MHTMHNAQLLVIAARLGRVEEIQRLLPLTTLSQRNYALGWAAEHGQISSIQTLLSFTNPKTNSSAALVAAAKHGHADCVQLLVPVSDPNDYYSAFWAAVIHNNFECAKCLIDVVDPKNDNSEALVWAALNKNAEMIDFLLDVCDPYVAFASLHENYHEDRNAAVALEDRINQRQHDTLRAHINSDGSERKHHKI